MIRVMHVVVCPKEFNLLYDGGKQGGVLNFPHFLSHFPQVFGQVEQWLMLELHEMIRVLHTAACTLFSFCFMMEMGRGECSKL